MRRLAPCFALAAVLLAGVSPAQEGAATRTSLRFEARDGRVVIAAVIGGRELRMLVDPAGANVLAPKVAAELGLAADAAASATAGTPAVRAPTVALGERQLDDASFYLVDLERWREIEGEPIDGVLGQEAFGAVVLTIDHAAKLVTLTERGAYQVPERAARLPLRLVDGLPLVAASVDGLAGEFALEPASRGPLTLYGGFVRQHELLDRYGHGHERVVSWGLGGPSRGYATRVGAVELGGLSAKHTVTYLRTDDRAFAGGRTLAGSIGGSLLARFRASYDLAGGALVLEPSPALDAGEPHDRAGLWLNLDGDDLLVAALTSNGPAARAQLQPHDRIVAVDGVPATQLTLAALRRRFAEDPAGTRIKISARRDGKVVYATLILADQVPTPIPPSVAPTR